MSCLYRLLDKGLNLGREIALFRDVLLGVNA